MLQAHAQTLAVQHTCPAHTEQGTPLAQRVAFWEFDHTFAKFDVSGLGWAIVGAERERSSSTCSARLSCDPCLPLTACTWIQSTKAQALFPVLASDSAC